MLFPHPAVNYMLPMPDYSQHRKMAKYLSSITPEVRAESLGKFFHAFQRGYAYYYATPGYAPKAEALNAEDRNLRALARRGISASRLPEAVKAGVIAELAPLIEELSAGIEGKPVNERKFKDLNRQVEPERFPGVFEAFQRWLDDSGIQGMCSAYAGAGLKIGSLFLQKNDAETSRLHYGEISEEGLPTVPASYMHIDSAIWPTVKILIYLNEIDIDTGPFRFSVGTHVLPSLLEFMVRKTNDGLKLPPAEFLALPEEFRQHALFGDFIDAADPLAVDLLAREWAVQSSDGDVICFDNNGVHRGGFVRQGHRLMLQMNFAVA